MVARHLLHDEDKNNVIESKPGEIVWRFLGIVEPDDGTDEQDMVEPREIFRNGLRRPMDRMGAGLDKIATYTNVPKHEYNQFISTTRNPELWFRDRRYRYEIHPELNADPDRWTGVDVDESGASIGADEDEVAFTGAIEPQAIVGVYDQAKNRTGVWRADANMMQWRRGGRFDWVSQKYNSDVTHMITNIVDHRINESPPGYELQAWRRDVANSIVYAAYKRDLVNDRSINQLAFDATAWFSRCGDRLVMATEVVQDLLVQKSLLGLGASNPRVIDQAAIAYGLNEYAMRDENNGQENQIRNKSFEFTGGALGHVAMIGFSGPHSAVIVLSDRERRAVPLAYAEKLHANGVTYQPASKTSAARIYSSCVAANHPVTAAGPSQRPQANPAYPLPYPMPNNSFARSGR